jgi:hypothetical protein
MAKWPGGVDLKLAGPELPLDYLVGIPSVPLALSS